MIISDQPKHKVDVQWVLHKDSTAWLQITTFSQRHPEDEWSVKIIKLSEATVDELLKILKSTTGSFTNTKDEK